MSYKLVGMILLTLFIAAMASVTTLSTADDLSYVDLPSENMTINIEGYYSAQDGGGHQRVFSLADDGSGIPHENGYWNIAPHYNEVSTLWFGLKGDGTNEDSTMLYKAFNYGKKLTSPAEKTYLIDQAISLDKSIDIDFNNSTIKCSPQFSLTSSSFVMLLNWNFDLDINLANNKYNNNLGNYWSTKITRTVFDGSKSDLIQFEGTTSRVAAIYLTTSNVNINNCTFKNMIGGNAGVNCAVAIIPKTAIPENVYFTNNFVTESGSDSTMFGGIFSQGTYNYIHNNEFSKLTDTPIAINGRRSDHSFITENVIIDQDGDGIALEDGPDNAVIANNYIEDFGTVGISAKDFEHTGVSDEDEKVYENILITNNTIKSGKTNSPYMCEGIHIDNGKNVTITNNQISDIDYSKDGNSGITISGESISILSNTVEVGTYALKISGFNHTIYSNKLKSDGRIGIKQMSNMHNVDFQKNDISSNWQCLKLDAGFIGGIIFTKDNVLTKKEPSLPYILYPVAATYGITLNGRLSSNKIFCDEDGVLRRELLSTNNNLDIPAGATKSVILDDDRPWTPADHNISRVSILSGDFTVDDSGLEISTSWANAYQTVVVSIKNNRSVSVTIDKVLVEIEGTRIEG